jgi:hypothetical protein
MEWLEGLLTFLIENYALYLVVVMGVIVTFITCVLNLLKKPIKMLTGKISNEKLRKLANKSIIVLSFGVSVVLWLLLHKLLPDYFGFSAVEILITGALPVVVYAFGDGILTKSKAQSLSDAILAVVEDKEVTKEETVETAKTLDDLLSE